ncbi:MAG TPA: hypothetical protein VFH39_04945 [Candidatus Saccharimonadales bacterium]|nr:hypothetical protein [Candidatus Saccharimonadales bacterium]
MTHHFEKPITLEQARYEWMRERARQLMMADIYTTPPPEVTHQEMEDLRHHTLSTMPAEDTFRDPIQQRLASIVSHPATLYVYAQYLKRETRVIDKMIAESSIVEYPEDGPYQES